MVGWWVISSRLLFINHFWICIVVLHRCGQDPRLSLWIQSKEASLSGMVVKRMNITERLRRKLLILLKKGRVKLNMVEM